MKQPRWKDYLEARFGVLPDAMLLDDGEIDEDLSPEEWERRAKTLGVLIDALTPYAIELDELTVEEFATLVMVGVTAQQFAIICEARRAAFLNTAQWKAVSNVIKSHPILKSVAATTQ